MGVLEDTLQTIYERDGELDPEVIVEEARDASHPLHHRFEWDDAKAAAAHRVDQARDLIRQVKVTRVSAETGATTMRRYWSVERGPSGRTYKTVDDIAEEPLAMKLLLRQCEREWGTFMKKYRDLAGFWEVVRKDMPDTAA